jgi:hypothetical protein
MISNIALGIVSAVELVLIVLGVSEMYSGKHNPFTLLAVISCVFFVVLNIYLMGRREK